MYTVQHCYNLYVLVLVLLALDGKSCRHERPISQTITKHSLMTLYSIVLPQGSITTNTALASVLSERKEEMPPLSVSTMRLPNSESYYVMVGLLWGIGAIGNNSSIIRGAKRSRLDYWVRLSFAKQAPEEHVAEGLTIKPWPESNIEFQETCTSRSLRCS